MAQIIFNQIPYSAADLVAPGRGAEQWHDRTDVNIPSEGTRTIPRDRYQRFVATRIANATKGSYNWTFFDSLVKESIANNQKLSFGYMTVYTDGTTNEGLVKFSDGSLAAYPEWLHKEMMQNGGPKPWKYSNYYIPNYNNTAYLDWLLEFNKAIDSHIKTTSAKNVVNIVDIRGMGNWGEWHHYPYVGDYPNKLPAGQQPTFASLKRIVDSFLQGFPDNPLVAMISAHDREFFVNTWNPPAISDYLATAKNNWGSVGYRNDHWGGLDTYTWTYLDHPALANVWKGGYITGEPPGSTNGTNNMGDLERQVKKYHVSMFGNGNMGGGESNSTVRNNVRAASKASGYRLVVESADFTPVGKVITVKMNWHNVGLTPTYEKWDVTFELVNSGGQVVFTAVSSFKLRLFLPQGSATVATDTLNVPASVANGSYSLRFTVKDPANFRSPLPLAINGRNSDGSYSLGSVNLSGTTPPPPPNVGPIANAGGDKEITLPMDFVTLQGTGTDQDGSVQIMLWERDSGSGTIDSSQGPWGNTTIRNLLAGTSVFKLTVTDDKGATASDTVNVKVNPEDTPPPPPPTPGKKLVDIVITKITYTAKFDDGSTQDIVK